MMRREKQAALKEVELFVLDMDGTIYLGDELIAGAIEFMQKVKLTGRDFILFTNNSSRTAEFYQQKLAKMGCQIGKERIITSGDVTIDYLKKWYPGKKIYLMGTPLLEESFKKSGVNLVEQHPDVVVASFDTSLTYEKLDRICRSIHDGAIFLATHLDLVCPLKDGFMPDCGSICALITKSTGVEPKYLGKPFPETMAMILAVTGYKREKVAFVGDRLYTDVATGVNNGGQGFLVLSGEASLDDVEKSDVKPDGIFTSLAEMALYL